MLEIRLLGQFDLRLDGAPVEMAARPAQSLFAYLLLNASVAHRRERLAGMLWPDSDEERARRNLRQALWQVRRALGAQGRTILRVDEITLAVDEQSVYWLDVDVLNQPSAETLAADELSAIVSLYGGELLPGFYDEWVLLERERLQAQFEQKMNLLLTRLVAERRWPDVLRWGEQWIALGHTPEPAYRALMLAHAKLGDTARMAEVYRRCSEALQRDLAVEPSEQTRALYEQLRRGEPVPNSVSAAPPVARTLSPPVTPRHNLPIHLTSFIGREKEITEIKRLLAQPTLKATKSEQPPTTIRLLTLTGAGGTGKTRLALQVAAQLLDHFPDGVWWIELGLLSDPELAPQTLAAVLGVREEPNYPLTRTLIEYLRTKTLLLLLDNCEHLIESCAQFVTALLSACPQLQIMTTSRETLGVSGETVLRVPSLALPTGQALPPLAELHRYEAVRLFVERATTVQLTFQLTETNAAAVVRICRQLDGVPLAIELAAARVRTMTPEQIAARLDDRFRLLTGGSRTALPRQQTLRALIDWSWDLLTDTERRLLRQLAVFVAGWTLEAAEAVCAETALAGDDVLTLLTHLVEKSLVLVEEQEGAARYYLLETIRQYALDKLLAAGESALVRSRHLAFFDGLAAEAEPHLRCGEQLSWLARLDTEHDNLRAALKWGANGEAPEAGLRLAAHLARFWYLRGYWKEGREWLKTMLAQDPHETPLPIPVAQARIKALCGAGWLANDDGSEVALYTESLALCQQIGDKWGEAFSLRGLAAAPMNWVFLEQATARSQASLALFRELQDSWGTALALFNLGWLALGQNANGAAETFWTESRALFEQCGDRWGMAVTMGGLGYVARLHGQYARAAELTQAGLARFRELGDKAGVALSLGRLGHIALRRGDYGEASALLQASLSLDDDRGDQEGILNSLQLQGVVACYQGDFPRALALLERSLSIAREREIADEIGDSLGYLAFTKYCQNEIEPATALFQESLTLFLQDKDGQGQAYALHGLGQIALAQRDYALAADRLQESLRLWQARGDRRHISYVLNSLGKWAQSQGDHVSALVHFRESLLLCKQMVDKQGIAEILEGLAGSIEQAELAAQLFAVAHTLRQTIGAPIPPVARAAYTHQVNTVRERLGETLFAAAWTAGCTLTVEQAITDALG